MTERRGKQNGTLPTLQKSRGVTVTGGRGQKEKEREREGESRRTDTFLTRTFITFLSGLHGPERITKPD